MMVSLSSHAKTNSRSSSSSMMKSLLEVRVNFSPRKYTKSSLPKDKTCSKKQNKKFISQKSDPIIKEKNLIIWWWCSSSFTFWLRRSTTKMQSPFAKTSHSEPHPAWPNPSLLLIYHWENVLDFRFEMGTVAYPSYVEKEAACYNLHQPSLW